MNWIASLFIALLIGCSHTQTLPDLNYPLADVKKAVGNSLPGGVAKVSPNGREYRSNYFDPISITVRNDKTRRHRKHRVILQRATAYAQVLSDRRPYKVKVWVRVERRITKSGKIEPGEYSTFKGVFEDEGTDERLAKIVAAGIHDYLVRRHKNKNLIDDFRPF